LFVAFPYPAIHIFLLEVFSHRICERALVHDQPAQVTVSNYAAKAGEIIDYKRGSKTIVINEA
jgi:hypothetical protein